MSKRTNEPARAIRIRLNSEHKCNKLANSMPRAIFLLNKSFAGIFTNSKSNWKNSWEMNTKHTHWTNERTNEKRLWIGCEKTRNHSELQHTAHTHTRWTNSDGKRKDVMIAWYKKIIIICSRKLLCIIKRCSKYKRNNGLMIHSNQNVLFSNKPLKSQRAKKSNNEQTNTHTHTPTERAELWSSH